MKKKKNHKQQVELLQILTIKWINSKVTECTCYCVCVGVWSVVGVCGWGDFIHHLIPSSSLGKLLPPNAGSHKIAYNSLMRSGADGGRWRKRNLSKVVLLRLPLGLYILWLYTVHLKSSYHKWLINQLVKREKISCKKFDNWLLKLCSLWRKTFNMPIA